MTIIKYTRRSKFDTAYIIKSADKELKDHSRRAFLSKSLTLGGLSLLTGCTLSDEFSIEKLLRKISEFNDRAQAAIFDPKKLAPTYPESMMTRPFPFNAFYSIDKAPVVDPSDYQLDINGLVADDGSWTLDDLYALPQTTQVTRHICVEGWSAIGKWGGVTFSTFLDQIGADKTAKYVRFDCADDYYTSIDMPTALHPQTLLTFTYDGQTLPRAYGFPMKLRMPTKLGYKNPKYIMSMTVTNDYPGGYWEDQGYNWFGGS
jgi:DMSO/TMAO reductase YedYZ molybdopterin-dependent catalytic subunit